MKTVANVRHRVIEHAWTFWFAVFSPVIGALVGLIGIFALTH